MREELTGTVHVLLELSAKEQLEGEGEIPRRPGNGEEGR